MAKFDSEKYSEIHALAKKRFQEVLDYESAQRSIMLDDKRFSLGEDDAQWDASDVRSRKSSGRSFLTIMRSNQFTDHIKNQQRQNKPSIKISPTDEGAQEEAARLRQGLIRHIQYESKAQQARQAGFDDAVDEGRGHWIVKTEFVDGTFNKKICIEPIPDARSVYMDWRRKRPDYSDCEYGFVLSYISRDEFEDRYPDISMSGWDNRTGDAWYSSKSITVAEYYCKTYKTRVLLQIKGIDDDGNRTVRNIYEDELKTEVSDSDILQRREVEDPVWMWYKMTGSEIIDEEILPWKEIPIITVVGKETVVDGDWVCKGLIRDIKQPLRLYNFLSSNEADIIAKAPRAPWVGAEGQFEGYEDDYANSNIGDVPYLQYKPVSLAGQLAPPPQRAQYSVDLHNIVQQKMAIIEDIKAITGIYDASIGNRSNETSGVAIRMREAQGNNANYHYIDNQAMAINHEGRVINSALDVIYDTKRTVTIMGEDDEEMLQTIEEGGLGDGNYNVTVSVGPSFNTQREEQAVGMLELLRSVPLAQNVAPDVVVRSQDWVGKDVLADRLEFAVEQQFPGITTQRKPEKGNEQLMFLQQQLQQCKQQLQQASMQMQQMGAALEKAQIDKIENEKRALQLEYEKLKLEEKKAITDAQLKKESLEIEREKIKEESLKADLDAEVKLKINRDNMEADLIKHVDIQKSMSKMEVLEKRNED